MSWDNSNQLPPRPDHFPSSPQTFRPDPHRARQGFRFGGERHGHSQRCCRHHSCWADELQDEQDLHDITMAAAAAEYETEADRAVELDRETNSNPTMSLGSDGLSDLIDEAIRDLELIEEMLLEEAEEEACLRTELPEEAPRHPSCRCPGRRPRCCWFGHSRGRRRLSHRGPPL